MDNTNAFTYHLNRALRDEERIFKLAYARLSAEDTLNVLLLVNAKNFDTLLDDCLKDKIKEIVRGIVPEAYRVRIEFKKTITEERYILSCLFDYLRDESPLIFAKVKDLPITIAIAYTEVKLIFSLSPDLYSYMATNDLPSKIARYIEEHIIEDVTVEIYADKNAESGRSSKIRRATSIAQKASEYIEIHDITNVIGTVARMPKKISEVKGKESENQTVCGTVSKMTVKEAKSTGKKFFVFSINDTTGTLDAIYFPRSPKSGEGFESLITDGKTVCCEGAIKLDSYSHDYRIYANRLGICTIDYASISVEQDEVFKEEEEEYLKIKPAPYSDEEQSSLFSNADTPELIKDTVVVFDLETTGLTPNQDKIIEIGAVKMVNGVMTETFGTLINPGSPIPPSATAINNISDADVAFAPSFADVVGDFYKFTRNSVLVAHNAQFDTAFLKYHARLERYNFENDVIDTLQLARESVPGRKHTLEFLCKHFSINLTGAHRAVNDAEATAKLLKILASTASGAKR